MYRLTLQEITTALKNVGFSILERRNQNSIIFVRIVKEISTKSISENANINQILQAMKK